MLISQRVSFIKLRKNFKAKTLLLSQFSLFFYFILNSNWNFYYYLLFVFFKRRREKMIRVADFTQPSVNNSNVRNASLLSISFIFVFSLLYIFYITLKSDRINLRNDINILINFSFNDL